VVVEAPTLKEALKQVRARHGEDARVIRSRTLMRRQPGGLGQQKVVEVLVEPGAGRARSVPGAATATVSARLTREIAAEVERIEQLVRQIAVDQAGRPGPRGAAQVNPVAEALVAAGAGPGVVTRLAERCQAETGADPRDRAALLEYVTGSLPTGRGGWADLGGVHVFLGGPGAGRTDLVLASAGCLCEAGRQVLVLSLLPRHGGEIRRLQADAAQHGYDAAVIQKASQFAAAAEHLERYDVVLIDAPALQTGGSAEAEALRREIVGSGSLHRHLVFPLDRDLRDCRGILDAARTWNCDWIALSRVDQCGLRGKILDLVDQLPLPISLLGAADWPNGLPRVASQGALADLVFGAATRRDAARG
jgi:hypothetical protein